LEASIRNLKPDPIMEMSSMDQRETKVSYLYNKAAHKPNDLENQMKFQNEVGRRMKTDSIFERLIERMGISIDGYRAPTQFKCIDSLIKAYSQSCGEMSDYDLKYSSYFVFACETLSGDDYSILLISSFLRIICQAAL
jgi:hypothetical protein